MNHYKLCETKHLYAQYLYYIGILDKQNYKYQIAILERINSVQINDILDRIIRVW